VLEGFPIVAALSDEVKEFIVQALACFDTPQQVADDVQQQFGVSIPRGQVTLYDPTKRSGRNLGQKLTAIFHETRKAFLEEMATIQTVNKAVRIRRLERLSLRHETNPAMAAHLLEQIAKEVGGVFSNKRQTEMTGADGGPIEYSVPALDHLPAEELAAMKAYCLARIEAKKAAHEAEEISRDHSPRSSPHSRRQKVEPPRGKSGAA
jgi:hypothetical protein